MKWDKLCGTDRNDKMGNTIWDGGSYILKIKVEKIKKKMEKR